MNSLIFTLLFFYTNEIFFREIRWRFGISHIPFIMVVKPDGTFISRNALEDLDKLGLNVIVAWSD